MPTEPRPDARIKVAHTGQHVVIELHEIADLPGVILIPLEPLEAVNIGKAILECAIAVCERRKERRQWSKNSAKN